MKHMIEDRVILQCNCGADWDVAESQYCEQRPMKNKDALAIACEHCDTKGRIVGRLTF